MCRHEGEIVVKYKMDRSSYILHMMHPSPGFAVDHAIRALSHGRSVISLVLVFLMLVRPETGVTYRSLRV